MENSMNHIKVSITATIACLTAFWGWLGWLLWAWIASMALDVATGMAAASKEGEWASSIARDGIRRKIGCIAAVLIAAILDLVMGILLEQLGDALPFGYTVFLCPLVVGWYLLTEAGSIIENVGSMGAPVPPWLKKAIAVLKNKVDSAAGENS